MITVFNAQNYAQQWFFDKAFALLEGKNLLNADEIKYGRFLSLDGYFAHMRDLVLADPVFTMIPSDEEPFVIDANARTISIPAAFNKCAGVVGDDMCEIVTFTIDRYFDYVDLATAQICVQWSTAEGEGISHIGLRDLETIPGKIRFGWPLTSEMTKKAGPITFAVRFFMKDADTDKFVYLLNTLSTTITIRPTLILNNPGMDATDVTSLFGQFVQSSTNPTYPTPAPVYFNNNPGLNLLPQAKIDEHDQLIMKAQAVVSDNGHINYNWYFKENARPDADTVAYNKETVYDENAKYYIYNATTGEYEEAWPNELNFAQGTYYTKYTLVGEKITPANSDYEISEVYEPIATPEARVGSEQYFVKVSADSEPEAYDLVTSLELPQDIQLYERYTQLEIKPGGSSEITGLYWVGASNYVGEETIEIKDSDGNVINTIDGRNHTPEVTSVRCYVPTPDNVNITTDLVDDLFMDVQDDKTLKATLKIAATEDAGNPERTYSWYLNPTEKKINREDDGNFTDTPIISEVDKVELDITDPAKAGWYYVHIDSALNRKQQEAVSKVCRVIEHTKAPVLKKMEYKRWTEEMKALKDKEAVDAFFATADMELMYDDTTYDADDPETFHEMTNLVANRGDIIRLKITTDLDNERFDKTGLKSDKLVYRWFVVEPDKEPRKLDISDIDVTGNGFIPYEEKYAHLHMPYIDIRCRENDYECHFYCVVENTLAGEMNTLDAEDYKLVFKVW